MKLRYLVTHSGGFHADELLSSVVLSRLYPDAEIIRSREADWIAPASDRLIFDVGRVYDVDAGMFDHHQSPAPSRATGEPYSSFGLIWRHFGRDYLSLMGVPADHIEVLHGSFEREFVLPVDLLDNGAVDPSVAGPLLSSMTLPALLEHLKPVFDERSPEREDAAFAGAMPIARAFVEGRIRHMAADLRAASIVAEAIRQAGSSRVLELPLGMPYRRAIEAAEADHLLFVIHPREGDWALNGIRLGEDTFAQRADLPAAWAGLAGPELEAACGVPGARFCHLARFIAVAQTREAIVRMAELAVAEALQAA